MAPNAKAQRPQERGAAFANAKGVRLSWVRCSALLGVIVIWAISLREVDA